LYGWIPIEIVKNEIIAWSELNEHAWGNKLGFPKFTWQQAYRLRQDVGRMLEELAK